MALISQFRLLILAALLATPAAAQIDLNAPRDPSVIRVDVKLVNLLCTVRDKNGGYVNSLSKDDFEVYEDGKRQPVTHFAREVDSPVTVALLLDVSGSVQNVLAEETEAARHFFSRVIRPGDRAVLVGFAQYVQVWQDLTSSQEYLSKALEQAGPMVELEHGPMTHGGTLLYDAINLVTLRKLRFLPGRKTVVLLTDGEDNGSIIGLEEAVKATLQADAVIYGVHYDDYLSRGNGMRFLEAMSNATGGHTFNVSKKLTVAQIFAAIEDEMRNQYAVGYSAPTESLPGAYHKLEVKMTKPGLTVQSRMGYYTK